jgi:hypothetical protein
MSTVMIVLYKDLGNRMKNRRNIVKKTARIHVAQLIEAVYLRTSFLVFARTIAELCIFRRVHNLDWELLHA